ncbi:hypothetical protein ACVDG8_008080 [Mesorhizobium sp. ORM8.1]
MAEINLELLVGQRLLARDGETVGYIEAIRAEQDGDDLVVTEFHVGAYAALERLSALRMGVAVLDLFRLRRPYGGYRIPWDKLDISDPRKPRLLCSRQELAPLQPGS